jgi:hypothetical protein
MLAQGAEASFELACLLEWTVLQSLASRVLPLGNGRIRPPWPIHSLVEAAMFDDGIRRNTVFFQAHFVRRADYHQCRRLNRDSEIA